jgi:hypothetical protein
MFSVTFAKLYTSIVCEIYRITEERDHKSISLKGQCHDISLSAESCSDGQNCNYSLIEIKIASQNWLYNVQSIADLCPFHGLADFVEPSQ